VKGGTPEENAAALRRILDGEKGALRNVVIMNGAAALLAGNATSDLKSGAHLAEETIDSGRAKEKLDKLVELSQSLG
jgi:anthranilate phosphoribosyltransferase